jgi:hypothetical protein
MNIYYMIFLSHYIVPTHGLMASNPNCGDETWVRFPWLAVFNPKQNRYVAKS